jgi:excisionase family DNA binding protein
MSGHDFDPIDFQPNSVGVMVVRVIRIKDIVRTLNCTEDFAHSVVREIRGETSADGSLAFVLPSQLAAWTYKRAGKEVSPIPFKTVRVNERSKRGEALKRAARESRNEADSPQAGGVPALLEEVRHELSALKSRAGATDSAVTVEEARRRLGCGRTRVFALLSEGRLRAVQKAGRRTMISAASVEAFLSDANERPTQAVHRRKVRPRSGSAADAILRLPV